MYQVPFLLQGILGRLALILLQHKCFFLLMAIVSHELHPYADICWASLEPPDSKSPPKVRD